MAAIGGGTSLMLAVDRQAEPPPACLSDRRTAAAREALLHMFAGDRLTTSQTRFEMASLATEDQELQAALERVFGGRCAFCERPVPTSAYRFRPTEEAGPFELAPPPDADRAHLYYVWLANSWDNIYAICEGCRPKEPSVFLVRGQRCRLPERRDVEAYVEQPTGIWRFGSPDQPIFLDPCGNIDLRTQLAVRPDGLLVGLGESGRATIEHFNLNRDEAARSRRDQLARYIDMLTEAPAGPDRLLDFAELAHGGVWYLLLVTLARKLGAAGGTRPRLTRSSLAAFYRDRRQRSGFRQQIMAAFEDLSSDPDQIGRGRPVAPPRSVTAPRPVAFHLTNFKSIEDLALRLPTRSAEADERSRGLSGIALMILGENAAGKSSVLEALALALGGEVIWRGLSLDAARYMLDPRLMAGPVGERRAGRVEVELDDGSRIEIAVSPGWPRPQRQAAKTHLLPVFGYGAFRMFLERAHKPGATGHVRSLFQANYALPNPEVWLRSLHGTPRFAEVARALRAILALDQQYDVLVLDEDLDEICLRATSDAHGPSSLTSLTPLSVVSSGFRSVLGMACDILRGLIESGTAAGATLARARALVLIDEVEAHLHPRWKMRIMAGLREALPNVTFIVTTHDPLCLRGMASGEVAVLRRWRRVDPPPDELPDRVEWVSDLPAVDTLTIEQLLTSDLFQLLTTDARAIEDSFASAGDLLALERSAAPMTSEDRAAIDRLRTKLNEQIVRSIPVGSTEIERLIQTAVEDYLISRRVQQPAELAALRKRTRKRIVRALGRI